jgi:HK97 family phage major capsid protein
MPALKEVLTQIEEKSKAVTALFAAEDAEIAKDPKYAMPAAKRQEVIELNKSIEELEVKAKDLQETDGIRSRAVGRLKELGAPQRPALPGGPREDPGERAERKSIGQRFLESAAFKDWLRAIAPSGQVSESLKGLNSPPVEFKDLLTGFSTTSAGAMVVPDFKPLVSLPFPPVTILDLITRGTTGSDTVEYPRVTAMTNAAAPTKEATTVITAGDEVSIKPQSALAFVKVTTSVKTIAHWIPATKRALSDAGQLRTLIDGFLQNGLQQTLASQVISGDATGEQFDGLLHVAGTTVQAFDTDILRTSRKAVTKARVVGLVEPTGFCMSPADWERFDLTSDNEHRYYFGGPSILGTPRLWGLPVAQELKMPDGTIITGDLRQAVLWDREQSTIQVSDSHADFFIRNLVAILAELRAAFGVFRPAAIVKATLA